MAESFSRKLSKINNVIFYIHKNLSHPLFAKELAKIANYSEQHFHRVFKEVQGESIHQYIRRTRLEYSANAIMFNAGSTVLEVALQAGFQSPSSFSRAFKDYFGKSPREWTDQIKQDQTFAYAADPEILACYQRLSGTTLTEPEIIEAPDRQVAYVRHQGYNRSIKSAWQRLQAWAISESRDFSLQFGLHHSNPIFVDLNRCHYVACLGIDAPINHYDLVSQLTIPGGLYARFAFQGKYGELLPQISQVYAHWLPHSRMKIRSTPSYVQYEQNQFLHPDEHFKVWFHLPVSLS